MFSGSFVAIVTPFKNNKVDIDKLKELVEFQIKNGTSGIVPCGTTGESATLSHDEHDLVIETVVKAVNKRAKVVAGTGSNSTEEALRLTRFAEKVGCDGALMVSPYYNKPTQKGLYLHFKKVADAVKIPIMLYNIQGRTAVNIAPETTAKLSRDCKNIVAMKEASGSLDQMSKTRGLCPGLDLLSGDDALTLPLLSIGGVGVVSVVANIVPKDVSNMVSAFQSGKLEEAQELHYKLSPLVKAMFLETNPIPVKTAMGILGMCSGDLRLPMCEMEESNKEKLKKAIKDYGLLK
ncbi:MAG: 4-hydroxy-tetrahydrodipicolinate synthase [Endomicrobiales bacterium]|nr:4-hydroxy-tetrahydrodipicolinate synthase [Endomicrobiales bacterium]